MASQFALRKSKISPKPDEPKTEAKFGQILLDLTGNESRATNAAWSRAMFQGNHTKADSPVSHEEGESKRIDPVIEKHFSIQDLAAMWKLSEKTVRKLFEDEPGVIEISNRELRSRRAYITRRIPESVAERVHRRLRKSA